MCVQAKARSDPHKQTSTTSDITVISMDYSFQRFRNDGDSKAIDESRGMPTLNMYDRRTKMIKFAIVPAKGSNDYASNVVKSFINDLAYKRLALQSD